jgi:hypothetical protein
VTGRPTIDIWPDQARRDANAFEQLSEDHRSEQEQSRED